MLLNFLGQQISIDLRLEWHESLAEAGGESWHGVLDTDFGACNFGGVARVEVVQCLGGCEF